MKKCVKIIIQGNFQEGFLFTFVKQQAQSLELEGTAQMNSENTIRIILCGDPTVIDQFMDSLHKNTENEHITSIELEPFLKEKDYRGVFRIIE
jgi:acylphosphatase